MDYSKEFILNKELIDKVKDYALGINFTRTVVEQTDPDVASCIFQFLMERIAYEKIRLEREDGEV